MEFLDTNVLVHAASDKTADQQKSGVARDLLRRGPSEFAISLQVLQEFYVAARAPRKLALAHEEALRFCGQWRAFTVLEPTLKLFEAALQLCARYQIGYYDAAILAAARAAPKCTRRTSTTGRTTTACAWRTRFGESRARRSPDSCP